MGLREPGYSNTYLDISSAGTHGLQPEPMPSSNRSERRDAD